MLDADHLLTDLTDEQRSAASHVDGPLLIIAGAGSGKTRVITRRVAFLMAQGIPPSSILAITFTNKAAGEMKGRIEAAIDRPLRDFGRLDQPWPTVCTFHSLCLRVLRHYATTFGLPTNFGIFDSSDQMKLVKEALKTLEMSTTNFPPGAIHARISNAKNQLVNAADFAREQGDFTHRQTAKVYAKYQQLLEQNNALDFDDLLLRVASGLREHRIVLTELQDRFQYILIDEYQDTNHAQYVIAHALALRHRNMCVVGDPDQSIYAWRGADIRNILDFEQDYPDAKVVRLEQNYRSTKTILAIASSVISHNSQRKDKTLWTENADGEKAKLFYCQDERDEADVVMKELRAASEGGRSWNDMAIFYRMNALSRVMEESLFKAQIPYQIARGVEFYNRKEIKDVLAYLRVVANPADEVSLERVVNVPTRGIGDQSVRQMQTFAAGMGTSLFAAMERASEIQGLSARAVKSTKNFVEMIHRFRSLATGIDPADDTGMSDADESDLADLPGDLSGDDMFADLRGDDPRSSAEHAPLTNDVPHAAPTVKSILERVVRDSGLEALYRKSADPDLPELANVNELLSAAAQYDVEHQHGSLDEYLSSVSLLSDADHMKGSGGAVTLMTLHAAKGLEFPLVAIIGLEDGCLPHARARDSLSELEEERRLCFVGITRAQEQLILSKAQFRTMRGLRERTIPSPFINEMSPQHLELIDRAGLPYDSTSHSNALQADRDDRMSRFKAGQLVRHPTFGMGRIAEISGSGQHTRANVDFNTVGRKTLVLQAARLEVVA